MTDDPEKVLAWEARHGRRAGIAALVGAVGLLVYFVLEQVVARDIPTASGLATLVRVAQDGSIDQLPSLRIAYYEYIDDKSGLLLVRAVGGFIGFIGLAWAAGFLGVATRARLPQFRRWALYLPIVGGVVFATGILVSQIATAAVISDFLTGPKTVEDAILEPSGLGLFAGLLSELGKLALAVGLVIVSLNAMRAGLLTRLLGYIGIAAGAMLIFVPLVIVQIFWLGSLGFILLGLWPGGAPVAWRTGQAEPWPVAQRPPRAPRPEPAGPSLEKSTGERRKRKKRH